jgi:hypothetical protein
MNDDSPKKHLTDESRSRDWGKSKTTFNFFRGTLSCSITQRLYLTLYNTFGYFWFFFALIIVHATI